MATAHFGELRRFQLFFGAHPYEVHFGRNGEGYFYEIEDLETLVTVDAKDGLSRMDFLKAVGCALEPCQFEELERVLYSLG